MLNREKSIFIYTLNGLLTKFCSMKSVRISHFIILLLGIFMFQNCQTKKSSWELKGTVADTVHMVYLYQMNSMLEKTLVDSVQVLNGKFTIEYSNPGDQLSAYVIDFDKNEKGGVEFPVTNGDQLKVTVKQEFNSEFSGTPLCKDFNRYNKFRFDALNQLSDLREVLANKDMSEEELSEKMLVFKEKMQELETEKIAFLRNIQNPELNGFLVLNEIISTGVIEKELFNSYINALTPEGAMTNDGHKIHQIYDVIEAYALSREMDILDTTTIRERYNQLDEVNKNSEFANEVKKYLENY